MPTLLSRNIAEEYAQLFSLPLKYQSEQPWQFRVRIARTLEQMGEIVRAHEALWNERMSNDPSATGTLTRGYDETFVTTIAQHVEAIYQKAQNNSAKQSSKKS